MSTSPRLLAFFLQRFRFRLCRRTSDYAQTVEPCFCLLPSTIPPLSLRLFHSAQTVEPNGELGFTMVFQSRATPFKMWVEPERIQKYVNFFGPGVDAEVRYVDRGGDGIQFVARCRACTNIALPQKSAMIRHHRKSVTPCTHIYTFTRVFIGRPR